MQRVVDVDAGLERLEGTLLTRLTPRPPSGVIGSVAILDLDDIGSLVPNAVVLAVGVSTTEQFLRAAELSGRAGASALVVREFADAKSLAPNFPGAVYTLVDGASWLHLASLIAEGTQAHADFGGDSLVDDDLDLFEIADSLADVLQAPLTIGDRELRVLAFSRDQTHTDESRRQTILGMIVPEPFRTSAIMRDVMRRVESSTVPVFTTEFPNSRPRHILRIVAGEEMLGSIWVIKDDELTAQQVIEWQASARLIGLALIKTRIAAAATKRVRDGHVAELIAGGTRARRAASRLGFQDRPAIVMVLGTRSETGDTASLASAERRTSSLQRYLRAVAPNAVAALIGMSTYVVAPLRSEQDESTLRSFVSDYINKSREGDLVVGIGRVVEDPNDLGLSCAEAEASVRVLIERPESRRTVAGLHEVWLGYALLTLADSIAVEHRTPMPELSRLQEYDKEHNTALLTSLRTWLECFGDVMAASSAMNVHRNTFRYRLARIEEIGRLSLEDPDTRLSLLLQLRIFSF